MKPITVQFSGSTKEYGYLVNEAIVTLCTISVGDRVVVPTKMKDDGTVSLSIATVVDAEPKMDEAALKLLKPVVCIIDRVQLAVVTMACAALNGLEVEVTR